MISDASLFVMVDDNKDELAITMALFRSRYPGIRFVAEHEPKKLLPLLQSLVNSGVPAPSIIVLIDIKMPGLNGFELIYALRNAIELHQVTIIVLSASRQASDADDAAAIGADGFLQKPFTVTKLEALLKKLSLIERPSGTGPASSTDADE